MAKHKFTEEEMAEGRAFLAILPPGSVVVPSVSLINDEVTWLQADFAGCRERYWEWLLDLIASRR